MFSLTAPATRENGDAPPQKRIFLALLRRRVAGITFPTSNELATETNIDRSTMRRLLQVMRDRGIVRTEASTKKVPCMRVVLLVDSMPDDVEIVPAPRESS
jgi:DNA-binding MarR family transcriptional regulator